ncbi:MAG TPA: 3'(2'),5'-bisphosphate nucleotidase [Chthonomonadaceae bacterium]|nr:3'(2'),5'-bisphosphate nucleotidase [Chthonomonadaceae bacterium]
MKYEVERALAIETVSKASHLCEAIRKELVSEETLLKKDKSPVTVADFAVQALVSLDLHRAFPADPLVAEEDTLDFDTEGGARLRDRVLHFVRAADPGVPEAQALSAIARGRHADRTARRYWVLDPIDGTKGFLRGEQYAIALALIVEGEVVLGVLGGPNFPHSDGSKGCLFAAVAGQGAAMRALNSPREERISVSQIADPTQAVFCESVESAHSAHDEAARIAAVLGVAAPPLRMDSQCKYAAVARGDASIYLRLPTRADYEEKVWDHAAGWRLLKEAGGEVSDIYGRPLDFSLGPTLSANTGVVATNGHLHAQVLAAIRQVLSPPH